MFLLLKTEIKICKDKLEYVQNSVIRRVDSFEKAKWHLQVEAEKCLREGYFDKVVMKSKNTIQLYNGGSAYVRFEIIK